MSVPIGDPLWSWSARRLAQAIRDRELSSREVVTAHLERIEAINPTVNAITQVLETEALSMSDTADRAINDGEEVGPLHGVPITIKEGIDLAGTATTFGVVSRKDVLAECDAPVISHLKRAGAIPIGRSNLSEYGLRWHSDNDLHGATVNPWAPALTPGGSSGGEAAALATGMSPLGVGNDMGGSLRYPAQCCGIASLRPSLGRVSRTATAAFDEPPSFYEQVASVNGPMARHVADLRLALEVMSEPDPSDPLWIAAPWLGAKLPRPIKVAVSCNPTGEGCAASIAEGVRRAATVLSDAGYLVEEVDPPSVSSATSVIDEICNREIGGYLPSLLSSVSKDTQKYLGFLLGDVEPDLEKYMHAIGQRHEIARVWSLFQQRFPLVLGPISTMPPFAVGYDLAGPEEVKRLVVSMGLTEVCNLLGLPSLALPVGLTDGLPLGGSADCAALPRRALFRSRRDPGSRARRLHPD